MGFRTKPQFNPSLRVEIKTEIFKEVCLLNHNTHPVRGNTPSKLSMVCKHWRDIIVTIPSVWSIISVVYSPDRDRGSQKKHLERHLELSNDLSLTISLSVCNPTYEDWNDVMINEISFVFDSIMKESKRVADLYIGMDWSRLIVAGEKFSELALANFPILKTAEFSGLHNFFPNESEYYNLFENSPCLRTLSIYDMEYTRDALRCFHQITELRLSFVSEQSCSDALFYLPQLENATFADIKSSDIYGRTFANITYPGGYELLRQKSLCSLTITDSNHKIMAIILESIICPSLLHLDLRELGKYSPEYESDTDRDHLGLMKSVKTFLKRSECSLQTFRIDMRTLGDKLWSTLQCVHSSIEKLHLEEGPAARKENIMPALLDKLCSATFLPRLRELHLGQMYSYSYNFDRILQTLITRRKISSEFSAFKARMVEVWDFGDVRIPDCSIAEGFNQLILEGMKISFKLEHSDHRFSDDFLDKIILK